MARRTTFGGWKPPRPPRNPFALAKPIRREWPKNSFAAAQNQAAALDALQRGLCLALTYHDCRRVVEVHTIGTSAKDRPSMSVFQVDGQCNDTTIPGWAFFCFDECFDVAVTDRPSAAPRPEYRKGAKQFQRIFAEI